MYHAMLVVGLCVAYVPLAYGFAWFFEDRRVTLDPWRTLSSIAAIALVATAANVVTLQVSDWQLANRILHTFGGGFAAYLVCVLAARDIGLSIGRLRFFIVATLIVTAIGVANEHVELALQSFAHLRFAASVSDTWLDLASNTAGIVLAAALFTQLVPRRIGTMVNAPGRE